MHSEYVHAHLKLEKCNFAATMAEQLRLLFSTMRERRAGDVAIETKFLTSSSFSELALYMCKILFNSEKQ